MRQMITPLSWTIPDACTLWTCVDCGVTNTSIEPIPEIPPGYDLEWCCEDCSRAWKQRREGACP
jgi:hypothetical protein